MIDLVVCGPDMSGTSTQVNDIVAFFKSLGKRVRDIRGTEVDALFHAEIFKEHNENYICLKDFLKDSSVSEDKKKDFIYKANNLLFGIGSSPDLKIASLVKNDITTFVDPDSADVWIMEEPVRRGSGQTVRTLENNRSQYNSETDQVSVSFSHQVYRIDEFYRFRKILREKDKIVIRSRSEESACYQIADQKHLKFGIAKAVYVRLPGNKIAFTYSPTHLFVVCGPESWTKDQYLLVTEDKELVPQKYLGFRQKRGDGRLLDDLEKDVDYQLLINKRYASRWLDNLYKEACKKYNSKVPEIVRFKIYDKKEIIRRQMETKLKQIMGL